jgi:hypothetical protein
MVFNKTFEDLNLQVGSYIYLYRIENRIENGRKRNKMKFESEKILNIDYTKGV